MAALTWLMAFERERNLTMLRKYCWQCGVTCNSERQWNVHRSSQKHRRNLSSDKERSWNYRKPPVAIKYQLCTKHKDGAGCEYSHSPMMYNFCQFAHSTEELAEWTERCQWRKMNREKARDLVYSYMDQLLERFYSTESDSFVMVESLANVDITMRGNECVYLDTKGSVYVWVFEIRTSGDAHLEKVALLLNKDRLHFELRNVRNSGNCQFAHKEMLVSPESSENNKCTVEVQFSAAMFGSFSQWVVFDFGLDVVVVRKLQVDIGNKVIHEEIKHLRQKHTFDRWTGENRKIVQMPKVLDELEKHLLSRYKQPDSSESVITRDLLMHQLNRNNYTHRMSKLLQLEELTRHKIISSYNMITTIELSNNITEGEFLCALPGELYAHVPLEGKVNEDTDAGELILTSVNHVLLAPQNDSQECVYEAAIVSTGTGYWRGQNYVYLHLPAECCSALKLKHGDKLDVEIQFQLDRLVFCKMHYAVDQMAMNMDVIFPDISPAPRVRDTKQGFDLRSFELNSNQVSAVRHIVAKREGASPLVIYGPFGTGKTETLAQAAMLLLSERPDARILICTESNKSADLYIEKHLDRFLKERGDGTKMLRLYWPGRRVNTVSEVVRQYCVLSLTKGHFLIPSKEEVMTCKVCVVTLDMSLYLVHAQVKGFFTHIFVDEAAQALECEAIKPLCLADPSTCVVLTGDHMQLGPTVYCEEARNLKFNHSLLERMCSFYREAINHISERNVPQILFNKNYRSKKEILQFLSSVFYGGPETLISESHIPSVRGISPLAFYSVQGQEIQEPHSTSYYNTAEMEEVVERVAELYNKWPDEWGTKDPGAICVTTSYVDQVHLIRNGLRRKSNELKDVTCERAHNIPGREFRAVFVSVVRTHQITDPQNLTSSLGFLSNPKLLNTALTRARSMVAVIGNPVSLCTLGHCRVIWRFYLKQCQILRSIYPQTLTMEDIKQGIQSVLNSTDGQKIVQHAEKSRSISYFPATVVACKGSQKAAKVPQKSTSNATSSDAAKLTSKPADLPEVTISNFLDDWELDCMLEPDDIIKQLAMHEFKSDLVKFHKKAKTKDKSIAEASNELSGALKLEYIEIKEQYGHSVICCPQLAKEERKRKLLSADDAGKEYDSDSDKSDVEDEGCRKIYNELTHQELTNLLQYQSDQYVCCILNCESRRMYAEVLSKECAVAEVEISCRKRCGRAFHGDEVVVRMLPKEVVNSGESTSAETVHGEVVGILKNCMDPRYRLFICTVEPKNTGVMIPLNRGVPRINNLSMKDQLKKSLKGYVQVYKFTKDREIRPDRPVKVDLQNAENQLYVVRYLKWDAKFTLPLGIVVHVIPPGNSIENGINILNIEYQIPKRYSAETEKFVQEQQSNSIQRPHEVLQNRLDYRDKIVITIDPPFSKDLDDALSLERLPDDRYLVGVHIADVSYFVPPGSALDREAAGRGVSFYPMIAETIHMLHPHFSTNVCSLLPDTDRLTVSVFFTVSSEGEILSVDPERCIIKAKRLSYTDVENLLHDTETPHEDIRSRLLALGKLAQIWRYQRLGNAYLSHQMDIESRESPNAHLLVEELMIMTNHQMGELLIKHFPECTPLRQQQFPHPAALEKWKETHAAAAANTVALTRPFLEDYSICQCKTACKCVFDFISSHKIKIPEQFCLLTSTWEAMCREADSGNYRAVQELIVQAEKHPSQMIAQLQLYKIQERAVYVCSGSLDKEESGHYSLNLPYYVHFTSPIRRYVDLVAQRLVCALIDSKPCPYSPADVERLCRKTTDASVLASRYHKACYLLQLAAALKERPLVVYPVVEGVSEAAVELQIPSIREISPSKRQVKLAQLAPSKMPTVSEERQSVLLHWRKRVYELDVQSTEKIEVLPQNTIKLDPDKFVSKVSAYDWQRLLCSTRKPISGKIDDGMQLSTSCSLPNVLESVGILDRFSVQDVTSEVGSNKKIIRHLRNVSTEIHNCAVLKAQMSASLDRGMLSPTLQLLSLTSRLDVCLEHCRDPASCFADVSSKPASKLRYNNEKAYKEAWLPVLSMESAVSSVDSQESLFLHNVDIKWHKAQGAKGLEVKGKFSLPVRFCKERQIKYSNSSADYLCIRYPELPLPENTDLHKDVAAVVNSGQPVTWTCHCWITSVMETEKEDRVHVECHLRKSAFPIPDILCQTEIPNPRCTLEWIPRFLPVRRMEEAVRTLDKSSKIAQDIAVGRTPNASAIISDIPKLTTMPVPGLPRPNKVQTDTITQALRQPFSLIQGPPGTGKTLTGARLAYLFVHRNRCVDAAPDKQPQVLYCGPSNKSVDVVAGHLKKLGSSCPKLVRVYSENIEHEEFPLPRDLIPTRRQSSAASASADPTHKDIALHHLIRKATSDYSEELKLYDEYFATRPEDVSDEDVKSYQQLVTRAEVAMIKSAEILLCTCSVSSSPRMRYGSCVSQVIIDECGMCTEPDSMIPIVNRDPSQVVLIGDHKQLRPIVASQQARDLGLETSLFERYAQKAVMLTYQYRMHKGIAQFPSNHFYEGKLRCGTAAQTYPAQLNIWPNGRESPILFCHVKGVEETLTVSTEEGNERSKSNQKEAYLAVHIVSALVRQFSVKETSVKVLSQYRAQCRAIERELREKGLHNAGVDTVISSQGSEWDYVILSTVRTLPPDEIEPRPTEGWKRRHLGFITDDHQINVAITRAKKGLFIIGDKQLLQCDGMWRELIAHYKTNEKIVKESELRELLSRQDRQLHHRK
ncbi:3'-5' exoribonuclease HELZ2-like [Liolophura sinensis]|uniref:3'-5' exoribonuclease HELZ2-like n=1 Tax=Liolophura sinensis TaxID=3198878 RepID=UPI003158CA61